MKLFTVLVLMLALIGLIGCKSESESEGESTELTTTEGVSQAEPEAVAQAAEEELMTMPSGVRYVDLVVGEGVEAALGMRLECHYTLWFADSTGLEKITRFQSSKDGGRPFVCTLGQRLIQGWSDGMVGMKEGGTRQIHVPWAQGYGDAEGGQIPAKTNLIFEIDFLRKM